MQSLAEFSPVADDAYYPAEERPERARLGWPGLVAWDGDAGRFELPGANGPVLARPGETAGPWRLIARLSAPGGDVAVLEHNAARWGVFLYLAPGGVRAEVRKSVGSLSHIQPDSVEYPVDYVATLMGCHGDVLGDRVLGSGEPSYDRVAGYLPDLAAYMPISDSRSARKAVVDADGRIGYLAPEYGRDRIRDALFDPCIELGVSGCLAAKRGVLGGHLPVADFAFVGADGSRAWEQIAFAPPEAPDAVYLGLKVDDEWSYRELVSGQTLSSEAFHSALLARWRLAREAGRQGMTVRLPEPRLADAWLAALLQAVSTYEGAHPRYGLGVYAEAAHDGFPPTTIWMVWCCAEWGWWDAAREYLGYYLDRFVNDDGTFAYYGPAVSEYGQMLDVAVRLARCSGDHGWLRTYLGKLDAMAGHLLRLRDRALADPGRSGATHGLLYGDPEADVLDAPNLYFSNNAWAWRGLVSYGHWLAEQPDGAMQRRGAEMVEQARGMGGDTRAAVRAATVPSTPAFVPPYPGIAEPFGSMTEGRLESYTNYRYWPEMLDAGLLDADTVDAILDFRRAHGGELLGTTRFERQMDDWPFARVAYALLERGRVDQYLLGLYGHLAHHQMRGTFTAYEQVDIGWQDERRYRADYCVPAQLTIPLMLKWALVFEERDSDVLWLAKAVPARWFAPGSSFSVDAAPTRWGPVGCMMRCVDHAVLWDLKLPAGPEVRLSMPTEGFAGLIEAPEACTADEATGTIVVSPGASPRPMRVVARIRGQAGASGVLREP
ncbi:MAG TPA: hypothetical protein PLD23_09095 [Armatimonadota bacterium]|nr:hypothetical protein [Armatimonadota bacterium]